MKHVKLNSDTAQQLNIAKSIVLKEEPQRQKVTDNDTIKEALIFYNKVKENVQKNE